MILDIGPRTVARIGAALEEARTLVWNGPLGAFETPPFDRGTIAVAKKVGELTQAGKLLSVAGGGDTVAALGAAGATDELSYVSTAGGAFLEWLEGRELPGVVALMKPLRSLTHRSCCRHSRAQQESRRDEGLGRHDPEHRRHRSRRAPSPRPSG